MAIAISVDPTHPWNDPADPAFRRNMQYVITDSNGQNGWSFTYHRPVHSWNAGDSGGLHTDLTGKPGWLIVSGCNPLSFERLDVRQWNHPLKSLLAYYVDQGYLIVTDAGVVMTSDQIRGLTFP